MDQRSAIELRGLTRRFGERAALKNVTVEVPVGATLAVLGRNGAGKSTLLRILATLLRPHTGEVSVLGQPLPLHQNGLRASNELARLHLILERLDLALQAAAAHAFHLPVRPAPKVMEVLAEPWRPWRAVAARLLWAHYRAIKGIPQVVA